MPVIAQGLPETQALLFLDPKAMIHFALFQK
jgi:hypothetical protein